MDDKAKRVGEGAAKTAGRAVGKVTSVVATFLKYLFAIVAVILAAQAFINGAFIAALIFLAGSACVFPVSLSFLRGMFNGLPGTRGICGLYIVAMIAGGIFMGLALEDAESAKKAEVRKEQQAKIASAKAEKEAALKKEFPSVKPGLLDNARPLAAAGDYKKVRDMFKPYEFLNDPDLNSVRKEAEIKYLTAEVKAKPASDLQGNLNGYRRLSQLVPGEPLYKQKVKHYQDKLNKKKAEEQRLAQRKKTIQSQFSSWDGSHRKVEQAIKASMHDPDSFDHVKTVYVDKSDHLIVQTTFRGKNAFGGLVINSATAMTSINGDVLALEINDPY